MTDLFSSKVQLLDLFADSVLAIETDLYGTNLEIKTRNEFIKEGRCRTEVSIG